MKYFLKIIYYLDINTMFIINEKNLHAQKFTIGSLINNIFYCIKLFRIKKSLVHLAIFIYFVLINIIKIIYLPIIIYFYFSKYRFCQVNFTQIGIINLHLSYMAKKHFIDDKIPIVFIPKGTDFDFLKDIFKNIKIIDNRLLYILSIPLKNSKLISFFSYRIDVLLNDKLENALTDRSCVIYNQFNLLKNNKQFDFNDDYEAEMENLLINLNLNFDLSKTFIIHIREIHPKLNNRRSVNLKNYVKSINYLIQKNYNVIRLIDDHSKKLIISNNYYELNVSDKLNRKLQYYLISKSMGLICAETGPHSIATILSTPSLETNLNSVHTQSVHKKGLYTLRKVKKNGQFLKFQELTDMNFYKGLCKTNSTLKEKGLELVENNEEEIFDAIKEFEKNLNTNDFQPSTEQRKFKSLLPDYHELKFFKSNISHSFLKRNRELF